VTLPSGEHGGAMISAAATEVAVLPGTSRWARLPVLVRHLVWAAVGLLAVYVVSVSFGAFRNVQFAIVGYLACAAAGLTVLTGLSGQISLGHGAFMAVGAYATALLFAHAAGMPLFVVLLIATLGTAVVGALVGAAAARLRGPYLAGATLAFAVGLPALANWRRVSDTLGGENGLVVSGPGVPNGISANVPLDRWQLWVAGVSLVVTLFLLANLSRSRVGRSWRAVRDDEVAASLAGLSVARLQIVAFVVSAACAGLAGALLAYVTGLAAPGAFTLALSLSLLTAIVLGGLGSLAGAVYGAFILVFLPTWLGNLSGNASLNVKANLPLAVYGVVLAFVMLVFPQGLQGGLRRIAGLVLAQVRRGR
jgi:branched-chain amino acid transport system permease protein